jgi:membrane protease YdiL (CAAX protease family)
MRGQLLSNTPEHRSPTGFFLLVFLLSMPIWVMGPPVERLLPGDLPVELPVSSLMAITPMLAALVLVWREKGLGAAKALLKRVFDYKRIKRTAWYIPILLLWPTVMVLQYGLAKLMGVLMADPQVPVLAMLISFLVFFIGALGEEVGWTGFAINPLQDKWSTLIASLILGTVWAVWHVVPLVQVGQAPVWIAWQCISMVVARVLFVWLYNSTGKSVFATILFHAMNNVSTVLLPEYGWPYSPTVATIILAVIAVVITLLSGPRTLAQYRCARPGGAVQSGAAS